MGSGTTIVAACLENRNAIGIELEPKYYNVAVQRTSGFTNSFIEPIIKQEEQETQDDCK
jgi:DNA modification methylase